MEHCRQCGARLPADGRRCSRCGEIGRVATLRGAAGRLLDDATEVGDRTLLGPPQVDDQATLLEDQLRFEDGRILHQGGARPTETLGSFGSTMPDAEAASDEEAAALLAATAVAMPSIRPTRALLEPGDQDFIGVSEPMPWGVLMLVQVPTGTFFQALPW